MDRKTALIIVFFLIVFIAIRLSIAFNYMNNGEPFPAELPVTYNGFLPVDDTTVSYYLILEENNFTEVRFHEGQPKPETEKGNWKFKADTLFLYDKEESRKAHFYVNHSELKMLDSAGEIITGEHEFLFRFTHNPEEQSIRRHHERLKNEGYNFIASGNEPFWSVRVDSDSISYRTPGSASNMPLTETIENDIIIYKAETETGTITAEAKKQYCADTMSGFLFTHSVTVRVDDESFSGCGTFFD